jgi:hypothetical protein
MKKWIFERGNLQKPARESLMRKFYSAMACFLHICLGGCVDYVKVEDASMLGDIYHFPPVIDAKHLSPHPTRLVDTISVGKNCSGQIFKVPPIDDRNRKDRLYYLWFIDNKLAWPESIIEPEFRKNAIVTLTINEQFLLSHFESKIPPDFFNRPHVIDFFVSDVRHTIPESRYIDDAKANEEEHSDYVYWIVTFTNDPC